MSEFNQMLALALRDRRAMNLTPDGQSLYCLWNARCLDCAAGDAEAGKKLGIGGWGLDADLVLIIALEEIVPGFGSMQDLSGKIPVAKQTVTYGGKLYRIDKTTTPPGLAFIALALIDATKGV
jgi:hypothetical protein